MTECRDLTRFVHMEQSRDLGLEPAPELGRDEGHGAKPHPPNSTPTNNIYPD